MDFLARMSEAERGRLLAVADTLHLAPGQPLIRRGEEGGDVYRLDAGTLEVLDSHATPATVLDVLEPGTIVGEMAFLDRSPRTADVRAAEACTLLHWSSERLDRLAEEDPLLGRSLYRAMAELVVERSRFRARLAAAGALQAAARPHTTGAEVERITAPARGELMVAEPEFRRDPQAARARTLAALDRLEHELAEACAQRGPEERAELGTAVAHQLHPYVIRSHLGELAMDRPSGGSEEPLALEHLHRGQAIGDGDLGQVIDAWLLDRATSRGLRAREQRLARLIEGLLPDDAVLAVVNGARGPWVEQLGPLVLRKRARLTVIEGEQDTLASAVRRLGMLPEGIARPVRVELVPALLDGARPRLPAHDLVVVPGLLDYLPDRAAVALLAMVSHWLRPGGHLLLSTLGPSPDDPIYRYLLDWPLTRRRPEALDGLLRRSGFSPPALGGKWTAGGRSVSHPGLVRLVRWDPAAPAGAVPDAG